MKLLVTGSNGFLGSSFTSLLKETNIPFETYDRVKPNQIGNFDQVVHFGGLTPNSILPNGKNPTDRDLYQANVIGTRNLLDQVLKNKLLNLFINVGSAAEYGTSSTIIDENSPANPIDYYGQTKLEQSKLIQEFASQTSVAALNLRVFNVIGHRRAITNSSEKLSLPIFESLERQFKQIKVPKNIVISNSHNVRDFLHIDDLFAGIVASLNYRPVTVFENINLCSGKGVSLGELVKLFAKILKVEYIVTETQKNYSLSVGNCTKASKLLSWKPKITLEESIRKFLND